MSSTDPFVVLGLNRATATQADVKAAYARLLKVTRPEEDRAGFMALREAFESARKTDLSQSIVGQELRPTGAQSVQSVEPVEPIRWYYDIELNWSFSTSSESQLEKEIIQWMVAGGPDSNRFVAEVTERLITSPGTDPDALRLRLVWFLARESDPNEERETTEPWMPIATTRPNWLNDDLIHALHDDLGLLRFAPQNTYDARDYNIVQGLLATVIGSAGTVPVDVTEIYARETHDQRGDAHGSYFERETMEWVDRSPVNLAMQDFLIETKSNPWGLPKATREILKREALQPLEEFQALDARFRALVCEATGQGSAAPTYPAWVISPVVDLLDDTFGWSHQYGRDPWQRAQYAWLHRVIHRDRQPVDASRAFHPTANGTAQQPSGLATLRLLTRFMANPKVIVAMYLSWRALQIAWRLAR